jgi:hypothetical protein
MLQSRDKRQTPSNAEGDFEVHGNGLSSCQLLFLNSGQVAEHGKGKYAVMPAVENGTPSQHVPPVVEPRFHVILYM